MNKDKNIIKQTLCFDRWTFIETDLVPKTDVVLKQGYQEYYGDNQKWRIYIIITIDIL